MEKILIIEDDTETAAYISKGLAESGYDNDVAADGKAGLVMALTQDYAIIIVDRMLPHVDGISIIDAVRKAKSEARILCLSALAQVDDKVAGLKAGADDYLTKPFAFAELLARIEALTRRDRGGAESSTLRMGELEIDLLQHRVSRQGKDIDLQPREFRLLVYLMRHAHQVVTRTMLLENVWDYHFDPQTNVIDVHISRLRGKIDRDFSVGYLHTIRGVGYCLSDTNRSRG